jgi:phosphatidylglycerol:prolipoprotein diacylglycerol transferase
MFEDVQSFPILGLAVYKYGLFLAAAAALWLLIAGLLAKKKNLPAGTVLLTGVLAIPLGLIFARLLFCLVSFGYFLDTIGQPAAMLYFWDGGLSMMGALLGISLAVLITARIRKIRFGELMDVLAVPAGLFIAVERLGEAYTVLGRGKTIEAQWMANSAFFGTQEAWGNYYAVFRYEALAAVLILCVMLFLFFGNKTRETSKPGDLALVFGTLFGSAQVIMESLRDDGHMLWGFVRASQIISILLPVAAIVIFSIRLIKREGMRWQFAVSWLISGAAIGLAIIKEFDIDTSNNLTREYALMSLAMAVLAAAALLLWRKASIQKQNP